MLFVLMRLAAYAGALTWTALTDPHRPWWQWALAVLVCAWGVWDRWKRPDEPTRTMRLGVWAEAAAVVVLAVGMHDVAISFLLISPLVRAAVHLPPLEALLWGVASAALAAGLGYLLPAPEWLLPAQLIAFPAMGLYAFVIGSLARERDRATRLLALVSFEREQRSRDEERIRIAGQLHDVMGQYWTGVIRALDVSMLTQGEQQRSFLGRAREAALEGLQEMRTAVHTWNDGRQTPAEWLEFLAGTVHRFRDLVGIEVRFQQDEVDWTDFPDPGAVAEAIVRTAAEALTNAVRHGGATGVRIDLRAGADGLCLTVQDNGRGLPPEGSVAGVGTSAMQDLAARLGGAWSLGPAAGGGALVSLTIPAQRKELRPA